MKSMTEQQYIVPCPAGAHVPEDKERGKGTAMQARPSEKNKGPHWRGGYAFQAPEAAVQGLQCRGLPGLKGCAEKLLSRPGSELCRLVAGPCGTLRLRH